MELTIKIEGKRWIDFEYALEAIKKNIEQEYVEGHDQNDTGSYYFSVIKAMENK